MKQQQKNDIFKFAIEFIADSYEHKSVISLSQAEEWNILLILQCWCVPHPVHIDKFWILEDILVDLKKRRWSNKRISKWLMSLITESKEIVPVGIVKDLTHTI
jgi:RIO-like serine/threonine protein kinase